MKKIILLNIFVLALFFSGCESNHESILPSANNVQETTNKTENTKVSEDIKIDKEYLEKKYPGKTVLTWVYTESENISKKERKKYNEPLGMKYITNKGCLNGIFIFLLCLISKYTIFINIIIRVLTPLLY